VKIILLEDFLKADVLKGIFIGCSFSLIVSCATTQKPQSAMSIPVVYLPIFAPCEPQDQEVELSVTELDRRIFTGGLVIATQANGLISVQLNSVLGDTIFDAKRSNDLWATNGKFVISINETKQGKLEIDGHELPIQSNELGCLVSGYWPMRWISILNLTEDKDQKIELRGTDEQRSLNLNLKLTTNKDGSVSSNIKSCAMLQWGGIFGFFRRSVQLCRTQSDQLVDMQLTGVGDYRIHWVIHNER
jgi:hypothetical protein